MKKFVNFTIFIFIIFKINAYPENFFLTIKKYNNNLYISENDIATRLPVHSHFDLLLQRGKFIYNNRYCVYQIGLSITLLEDRIVKDDYPVIRGKDGEVLIPLRMGMELIEYLFFEYEISIVNNTLFLKKSRTKKYIKPVKKSFDKIGFIVIDPGHGGKDPGAIGKGGVKEKYLTLAISKYLARELKRRLKNIKIVMTRKKDVFIELGERTAIANRLLKKGVNGIFVSIHCNASIVSKMSGFETYYLSQNPSNDQARRTAVLENNVIMFENPRYREKYDDVEMIEAIMLTSQIQHESMLLAKLIQNSMDKNINIFKSRGVKKADFFVLRGSLMPSVLVETGFVTNYKEKKYLKSHKYQKKLAHAIADGIIKFIIEYNKRFTNK